MKHSQQGVALISVLFIVVILTLLLSQIFTRSWSDLERTRWLIENAQAYQNALGGEQLARQILYQNVQELKAQGLAISPIPYTLPAYKPDNGEIRMKITDLQGLVNINNALANNGESKIVQHFIASTMQQPTLLQTLGDWLDSDSLPRPGGAEDFAYLAQQPGYRTGNRNMADISEIIALEAVSPELLKNLEPWVVALEGITSVNINTLPTELVSLIDPGISAAQFDAKKNGSASGFRSVEEFMLSDLVAGLTIDPSMLTVSSTNYSISTLARAGDSIATLSSRIQLDSVAGKMTLMDRNFLLRPSIKKHLTNLDQGTQDALDSSF